MDRIPTPRVVFEIERLLKGNTPIFAVVGWEMTDTNGTILLKRDNEQWLLTVQQLPIMEV